MLRSWAGAAAVLLVLGVAVIGFVLFRPGSQPLPIDHYRLQDQDTIVIRTTGGAGSEARVTGVVESADSVTVTVRQFDWYFGASTDVGVPTDIRVDLEDPLGDREVRDPHHVVPLDK